MVKRLSAFVSDLKKDARLVHRLSAFVLFALLYGFWVSYGKDKLYWESLQLMFRYSAEFFQETKQLYAGNIPICFYYVDLFLKQFFIAPWLGALVLTGLSALNYVLFKNLLGKFGFSAVGAQYLTFSLLVGATLWMFFQAPNHSFYLFAVLPILGGILLGGLCLLEKKVSLPNVGQFVKSGVIYVVFGLTIGVSSFVLATNSKLKMFNLFYKIEANVYHRDWASVLDHCNAYLHLTETGQNKGFFYSFVVDNTKFALVQTGQLLEDFFAYTRYDGFGLLFSQNLSISDMAHSGMSRFFSAMGLQSEAIRVTYNRLTDLNHPPFALESLIESHLIAGDYRPAVQLNNRLGETLFFRNKANYFRGYLEDTAKINLNPDFVRRRKLMPHRDFMTTQGNIDINILHLWLSNQENQRAGEYVIAMALSAKQHPIVLQDIEVLLQKFRYRHIPRHVEEALIVHYIFNAQEMGISDPRIHLATHGFGGMHVRQETLARADQFFAMLELFEARRLSFAELEHAFGDTYWFHVLFIQVPPPEGAGQPSGYAV
jgi:hypothetical protein